MHRRSVKLKMVIAVAAVMLATSCSAVREPEPSVTVSTETTATSEVPSETTVEETTATETSVVPSPVPVTEPSVETYQSGGIQVMIEEPPVEGETEVPLRIKVDEKYFKPQIEGDEFAIVADKTDYSALEDEILINMADSFVENGFMVFSADNLASKGVFLSVDDENYLYRGFMAMDIESEQSEVDYVYLMPEEVFDEIMEPMIIDWTKVEDDGQTITYSVDSLYISYLRDCGLMIYQAFPVG